MPGAAGTGLALFGAVSLPAKPRPDLKEYEAEVVTLLVTVAGGREGMATDTAVKCGVAVIQCSIAESATSHRGRGVCAPGWHPMALFVSSFRRHPPTGTENPNRRPRQRSSPTVRAGGRHEQDDGRLTKRKDRPGQSVSRGGTFC